jgi:uncharacterized protein YndB with AHSA1/START domain
MNPTSTSDAIVKDITIKASAERIFEALTDLRQRAEWWGVEGRFQVTHMESDLRPSGAWLMRGIGMGGKPFTVRGESCAIVRPRLLEFTWIPDWEEDAPPTLIRFELEEKDGVSADVVVATDVEGMVEEAGGHADLPVWSLLTQLQVEPACPHSPSPARPTSG